MKTIKFFVLCLLFGIATTKLCAQRGTDNFIQHYWYDHHLGIICDGVQVDYLKNEGYDLRQSVHYKDGVVTWWTGKVNDIIYTSIWTGEVFKVQIQDDWNEVLYHVKFFVIGHKGNHYTIKGVFNGTTWEQIGDWSCDCH